MLRRVHYAWVVVGVAFVALLGAAGFRSAPSVLMVPLQEEFGWQRATVSVAVSVNLLLYGLVAPFAAALIERFGLRRVTGIGMIMIAAGSGLTVFMTASWQLVLLWGILVGLGTGSMALVFAATVANRWFVKQRGLVTGLLTAASATGQLIFLPLLASLAESQGWRVASLVVAAATLIVAPFVWLLLRERPSDMGLRPYGAGPEEEFPAGISARTGAANAATQAGGAEQSAAGPGVRDGADNVPLGALSTLRMASRSRTFWLLVAGFAICGATTNGLIGTHFLPAAHDHGMALTTAAGLLALIGIFDIAGTVASGWLTDRVDSRLLLGIYYGLRGLSLLLLPLLLTDRVAPTLLIFVVFYGLDWIATVPPTVALCREHFGAAGTIVFGWVFASHQIGAAIAATAAGFARDTLGDYTATWLFTGALAVVAAGLSVAIRALPAATPAQVPAPALSR